MGGGGREGKRDVSPPFYSLTISFFLISRVVHPTHPNYLLWIHPVESIMPVQTVHAFMITS